MNNLVEHTIEKYDLLKRGDSVIVALSGGADSVTLLDVLNSLKEKYNLNLYAAHLNHNLRGDEAKRDENFCKILCDNYNIPLYVQNVDIKKLSAEFKISEELCGRNERYAFFEELSKKLDAKIATAHTASDNAETLLYNIARGTSVSGLSAIPPIRGKIIRPLIELTRAHIEQYCKDKNLEHVTDSSNLSDDYTRNKIRHNAVPVLKEVNSGFEQSAMRLSESAREMADFVSLCADIALADCKTDYGYSCEKLSDLNIAVLKMAIVKFCKQTADITPEYRHIELILGILNNGGSVCIGDNCTAVAKQGVFRIIKETDDTELIEIPFSENIQFIHNGKQYSVSSDYNCDKENYNSINPEIIFENTVFRTRRSGDKFTYPKRKITKPLRKVLNEMKVPSEIRDNLLVLANDSTILWCEGVGVSSEGSAYNSDKALKINITDKL